MKKLLSLFLTLTALCFTACGTSGQSTPVTSENTETSSEFLDDSAADDDRSTDEKIKEIAQAVTADLEQPEMVALRQAYLDTNPDETPAASIDRVVEVSLPENEGHISMHIYIINVTAWYSVTEDGVIYDGLQMVYDLDTGEIYRDCDSKYIDGIGKFEEHTKDYNICMALFTKMSNIVSGECYVYSDKETDIIMEASQLQTLNDQFHPAGWEYRAATILVPTEQRDATGGEGEPSESTSESSAETSGASAASTGDDSVDLCQIAITALKAGISDNLFAKGELIDHTVLAAKDYTILLNDTEDSRLHLLYIWMNGNKENGNDYAGQVLIDVDTGMTLYSSNYDESKIGFDHMDSLQGDDWMYYYFWQGLTAYDGSGNLMNDTEVLTPLSDSQISEIQAGL